MNVLGIKYYKSKTRKYLQTFSIFNGSDAQLKQFKRQKVIFYLF